MKHLSFLGYVVANKLQKKLERNNVDYDYEEGQKE